MSSTKTPSVGLIVHFVAHDNRYPGPITCRAAIITAVHSDTCLTVAAFHPRWMFFAEMIDLDETGQQSDTWHWPEHAACWRPHSGRTKDGLINPSNSESVRSDRS